MNKNMKNINLKRALLFAFCMLSFFAKAQNSEKEYVYNRDTIILSADSNIYSVENLGLNINSDYVESGPRISPDGSTLYFFRVNHPENIAGTEDIWTSTYQKEDSSWSAAQHMEAPLNCYGQNAVHWISEDGKTLLLHNVYYKNGTVGNGVSISHKEEDGWSFPEKLKIKGYKNNGICSFYMNGDMNVLLMCIEQKDSKGLQDIYVSFAKGKSGKRWTKPLNMGSSLNTAGTEATVWLNQSEDTLYFSSNGHRGSVGGMDVYRSVRTDTASWTEWSKPVNLGEPYNTPHDEYYFTIPDKGGYIYMAHRFNQGTDSVISNSDIVRIRLKEKFIEPYLLVSGFLFDDYSKDTIPGLVTFKIFESGKIVAEENSDVSLGYKTELAGRDKYSYVASSDTNKFISQEGTIDITALTRGKQVDTLNIYLKRKPGLQLTGKLFNEVTKDSINGNLIIYFAGTDKIYKEIPSDSIFGYDVFLPAGKAYDLKYNSKGYLSKIDGINLKGLDTYKEQKKDMFLLPLEEGLGFEIKNIFFALDKADLLNTSFSELDNLVKVMEDYPMIIVEISGHTDSQGSDSYNEQLSQRRSQSVVDYLIEKGIPKDQFVAKGYGEAVPVATNETKEGRQLNRRVEFKILKIDKEKL